MKQRVRELDIEDKIDKEILLPHININKLSEIERTVIARRSLLFSAYHKTQGL